MSISVAEARRRLAEFDPGDHIRELLYDGGKRTDDDGQTESDNQDWRAVEDEQTRARREYVEKLKLAARQSEAARMERIEKLLGNKAKFTAEIAAVAREEATLNLLEQRYAEATQRAQEMRHRPAPVLKDVDLAKLDTIAASLVKADKDIEAADAVVGELARRVVEQQGRVADAIAAYKRVRRAAAHRVCDARIAEIRPLLDGLIRVLDELRFAEEVVRDNGGRRYAWFNDRIDNNVREMIDGYDKEVALIADMSELY